MTNKEWLEKVKKDDEEDMKILEKGVTRLSSTGVYKIRKVKALEIIAEELIKLNDNGGVMELVKVGLND